MKKLIVTGGCGFIGSNFIKLALRKGYKIKIWTHLLTLHTK